MGSTRAGGPGWLCGPGCPGRRPWESVPHRASCVRFILRRRQPRASRRCWPEPLFPFARPWQRRRVFLDWGRGTGRHICQGPFRSLAPSSGQAAYQALCSLCTAPGEEGEELAPHVAKRGNQGGAIGLPTL